VAVSFFVLIRDAGGTRPFYRGSRASDNLDRPQPRTR
jgi:hypothetical protein